MSDRLRKILKLKGKKFATPRTRSRPQPTDENIVTFDGVQRRKSEWQSELNNLSSAERVATLTAQRQAEVVSLLGK